MSLYPQICLVNRMHLHDMKYIYKQNVIQNYHVTVVTINAKHVSR